MNNATIPEPKQLLQKLESDVRSGTWKIIRYFRQNNRDRIPDWCYLPQDDLIQLVLSNQLLPPHLLIKAISPMSILSGWRATQGIYRLNPDLLEKLTKTPYTGEIPVEALQLLPEWCVYVELPEPVTFTGKTFYGFFGTCTILNGDPQLSLGWVGEGKTGFEIDGLPLKDTLESSIQHVMNTVVAKRAKTARGTPFSRLNEKDRRDLKERFRFALPILIYLGAEKPDIGSHQGDKSLPQKKDRSAIVRKKQKVPSPRIWDVGWRRGPAFRKDKEEVQDEANPITAGSEQSHRPHIRRAHFHYYWVGSKSEPSGRRLILKWLEPIEVNVHDSSDLVPTVREVKDIHR